MSIARQLSQIQEVDIERENTEKTISDITNRLEASEALTTAKTRLAAERQHLTELKKQQHSIELDAGDVDARLKKIEAELYSGRVRNPKELSNLQRESEKLKAENNKLESIELELMEQVDQTVRRVRLAEEEYLAVEDGWQRQKQQLSVELERARAALAGAMQRRQQLAGGIDPSTLGIYQDVKRARGKAVVPVEKGICTGCRIAVSIADMQRVRSGQLVQCGSCRRILYMA